MKSLPANIILEKNKLNTASAWLLLAEITLTDGNVFRLARNTEDVAAAISIDSDLKLYWKCDDDAANTTVLDSSGKGHDGTASCNTSLLSENAKVDDGFNLTNDGGNQYASVADHNDFSFGDGSTDSPFSIAMWGGRADALGVALAKYDPAGGADKEWSLVINNSLQLVFTISDKSVPAECYKRTDSGLSAGWHHMVATYDGSGSANGMELYVDGVKVTATTVSNGAGYVAMENLGEPVATGRYSDLASNPWNERIDDIRLYGRVLTAAEVNFLYNSGNGTDKLPAIHTAFPFELETSRSTSHGDIPTVTLNVCNITRMLQPYLEALDGGIGSTIKITVTNSEYLTEDTSELSVTYEVIECRTDAKWITFVLGAENPLSKRFPLHRFFANTCRWQFRDGDDALSVECAYAGKVISGVTQANPGKVTATGHGFDTDDVIIITGVVGMTELNGNTYTITVVDSDNFTIGVDTSGYAAYVSDGVAGYHLCDRTIKDCDEHENLGRFGGFCGLRPGGYYVA